MDKSMLMQKLEDLKQKQQRVDEAWKKAGNKGLLEFLVDLIPRALGVERCSIFILDPVQDNVWLQCGTGLSEKQITVPKAGSLVGEVVSSGHFILEEDMENHAGAHEYVSMQTGFIVHNALCVPVHGVSVNRVTGAIQALNKNSRQGFTDEDRHLLEKLAFHLQMNIENIYLRQEMLKISTDLGKKIKMLESKLTCA